MKNLSPKLIEIVRSAMSGKRLEKFNNSIEILNTSLAQGSWTLRGSVKANSGFYQGLVQHIGFNKDYGQRGKAGAAQDAAWEVEHCLNFGGGLRGKKIDVQTGIDTLRAGYRRDGKPIKLKVTDEQIHAWIALCAEKNAAYEFLNEARPKPVVTPIGLSPKVTKTLTECNLDLDLPSIRMATIVPKMVLAFAWDKTLCKLVPVIDKKTGKQAKEQIWVVKWTKGIKHGQSRFAGGGCHACGKHIPSGMFVPIEARDKKSGNLISMWIGCDCSKNIFGIKDIGIDRVRGKNEG